MNNLLQPRNWEPACGTERSAASANNMAVLSSVLGCSFDRLRTGSPCDVPFRYGNPHPAVTRWPARLARMAGRHAHLRGLATAIHEISGLGFDLIWGAKSFNLHE
jgi:hypothetical protein